MPTISKSALTPSLPLLLSAVLAVGAAAGPAPWPEPLRDLIEGGHPLPRYQEAYYHPLGRSPVADAVLGDPLYLPVYGLEVSRALRQGADHGIQALLEAALRGAAVPLEELPGPTPAELPGLESAMGAPAAGVIRSAWGELLTARRLVTEALSPLAEEDRIWLLAHPEAYFFGEEPEPTGEYQFFTIDTRVHRKVFRLAASIDLVRLGTAQRCLARAADRLRAGAAVLERTGGTYRHEEDGLLLVVAGSEEDVHSEPADLLIDLGGDDRYTGLAGGSGGERPAALLVDLAGDDRYDSRGAGSQGAGLLGCGLLVDRAGDDRYYGSHFTQGAAWFGAGMLVDEAGSDEYRADFLAQGSAGFGFSVLWDRGGADSYEAVGMAQGAATTLGAGFLVEGSGSDRYRCGRPGPDWSRSSGIGQGGACGLRDYPWNDRASFYGGVAFHDDAGGDDDYYCPLFGQGGAYVFGVGVLVNTSGDDRYVGGGDCQGGVVHLAAGLLLEEGGNDRYDAGWGSQGIGGDRGTGILIDTGGDDVYRGGGHNLGSARKPKALGLMIDLTGDDRYEFDADSNTHLIRPTDPEVWSRALFLDAGGRDSYPILEDGLDRRDGSSWSFEGHGIGVDTRLGSWRGDLAKRLFNALPARPRVDFPFDPIMGWPANRAWRPLVGGTWTFPPEPPEEDSEPEPASESAPAESAPAEPTAPPEWLPAPLPEQEWLAALRTADFDERRQLIEGLDLARFTGAGLPDPGILAELLAEPPAPPDVLAFAAVWAQMDECQAAREPLGALLAGNRVPDPYVRRLLVRALGSLAEEPEVPLLAELLRTDPHPLCRRSAAHALGRIGSPEALAALVPAAADPAPEVRVSVVGGLRDSNADGALEAVLPLLADPDLYVLRGAAVTAISLGHKPAIPVLLESMKVPTLDTGWNYGHNLYATMGQYLGKELEEELGLELEKWGDWWEREGEALDLVAAIESEKRREEP